MTDSKDKLIKEMMLDLYPHYKPLINDIEIKTTSLWLVCKRLVDAGWRKQEKKETSCLNNF